MTSPTLHLCHFLCLSFLVFEFRIVLKIKKKTREKKRRRKKKMCLFLFEFQIVLKKTEGGKLKGKEKNGTAEFSDLQC